MDTQTKGNGLNGGQVSPQDDILERQQFFGDIGDIDKNLLFDVRMDGSLDTEPCRRKLVKQLLLEDELSSLLSRLSLGKTSTNELTLIREMRRELQNKILGGSSLGTTGIANKQSHTTEVIHRPATYVVDSETEITVTLELAGVEEKSVDVKLTGDMLYVKGEKCNTFDMDELVCCSSNCWSGKFSRIVPIGFKADAKQITAKLENGVLQIYVKKPQEILNNQGTIKVVCK